MHLWRKIYRMLIGELSPLDVAVPPNTEIVLTTSDSGFTLDFPLGEDAHMRQRRGAWQKAQLGIFLMMAAVLWFAACSYLQRSEWALSVVPLVAGICLLIVSAQESCKAWQGAGVDSDLRQITVAGNLLVRTTRDHQKQVWYRDEIKAIDLEEAVEMNSVMMFVRLHSGERQRLATLFRESSPADDNPHGELEWIASLLRQALGPGSLHESNQQDAHAIQDRAPRAKETRITT